MSLTVPVPVPELTVAAVQHYRADVNLDRSSLDVLASFFSLYSPID